MGAAPVAPPPPVTRFYLRFAEVALLAVGLAWKVRAPFMAGLLTLANVTMVAYQEARVMLPEAVQRTTVKAKEVTAQAIRAVLPPVRKE